MGKGRTFNKKLTFDEVNITAQTVDKENFKSVYITVSGWFNLETSDVNKLGVRIKKSVSNNMDMSVFHDRMISVTDAPLTLTDGIGHTSFEYTLFIINPNKTTINDIEPYTGKIIRGVYNDIFTNPDFVVKKRK